MSKKRVFGFVGPTASGKTALSLAFAERTGGEILCMDSMQVYRGMDIGTAKPTAEERARVLEESPLCGVYDHAVDDDSAFEKLAAKKEEEAAAQAQPVQAPRFLLVNGVLRQVVPPEQAREYVQYNGYLWPII